MKEKTSALIKRILRKCLRARARTALHARDLARINRAADNLNLEAAEVLDDQASDESRE